MKNSIPQITIFSGISVDGKMTLSKNISSRMWGPLIPEGAIKLLQETREMYDGIMVGSKTIQLDNSNLINNSKSKYRVVVDGKGLLAKNVKDFKIFTSRPENTIMLVGSNTKAIYIKKMNELGVLVHQSKTEHVNFNEALEFLYKKGIKTLVLEGGGTLNSLLLRAGYVTKIITVIFPFIVGGIDTPTIVDGPQINNISGVIRVVPIKSHLYHDYVVNIYKIINQ